jgi:hypothetical protein
MCEDCEKIEEAITQYRRLQEKVGGDLARQAADELVAELEAKMAALHPTLQ